MDANSVFKNARHKRFEHLITDFKMEINRAHKDIRDIDKLIPLEFKIELFCEACIELIDFNSKAALEYEVNPNVENLEKMIEGAQKY
jgi:hypothetical protein